jgi:nucleoside-diphosphate-sugar epimerase
MKALVTGSNGFLGAALVERLLAHGETDVRCLVRPGSDRTRLEAILKHVPHAPLELFTGTLSSAQAIKPALEGVDIVYHVAAGMRGSPADLFLSSVVASKNLLDALETFPETKVVHVSSFGVYGTSGLPRGHILTEETPLETAPERRDLYSYAKLRQEQLFWEYRERRPYPLVVLRPGVIYGPGGSAISSRVGLNLFGLFLNLGGTNLLPLSYVDNCAEAIAIAGNTESAVGQVYNVHDDNLPTSNYYLRQYRRHVNRVRVVRIPYGFMMFLSRRVEKYHIRSKGQLPAVFTAYKTATTWKSTRFDNSKLKSLGWKQVVTTEEGMRRTFVQLSANPVQQSK